MKISTKTGDKGITGLFSGERVAKDSPVIEALGNLDELQSFVGWCRFVSGLKDGAKICRILDKIQRDLYLIMAHIGGGKIKKLTENDVKFLDHEISKYEKSAGNLKKFILPGTTEAACRFHITRTVCRRAERRVVAMGTKSAQKKPDFGVVLKYLNRLSDLLFLLGCEFEAKK